MIIAQGLIDVNAKTKNKIRKYGKQSSVRWFKKNNKDFLLICKLADVDPNYILKLYKNIVSNKKRKHCLKDTLITKQLTKIIDKNSKDYYNFINKKKEKNDKNSKR